MFFYHVKIKQMQKLVPFDFLNYVIILMHCDFWSTEMSMRLIRFFAIQAFLYGIQLLQTIHDNTRGDEKSLKNSIVNLAESILT